MEKDGCEVEILSGFGKLVQIYHLPVRIMLEAVKKGV